MQQTLLCHRRRAEGGGCQCHGFLSANLPARCCPGKASKDNESEVFERCSRAVNSSSALAVPLCRLMPFRPPWYSSSVKPGVQWLTPLLASSLQKVDGPRLGDSCPGKHFTKEYISPFYCFMTVKNLFYALTWALGGSLSTNYKSCLGWLPLSQT